LLRLASNGHGECLRPDALPLDLLLHRMPPALRAVQERLRASAEVMAWEERRQMAERVGTAFVLRPGEGRSIDLGNFAMSLKAAGDETGGAFSLLEAVEPPGFGPPLHIHDNAAEAFYVLEGEYQIFL